MSMRLNLVKRNGMFSSFPANQQTLFKTQMLLPVWALWIPSSLPGARKNCFTQHKQEEVRRFICEFWDLKKTDQDPLQLG